MDIISYLLGKQSSGGGGGSDLDWSAIGYSNKTPQSIIDGYNLAVKIKNEWTPNSRLTDSYQNVLFCPMVDTSHRTSFNYFASNCKRLIQIPLLDTSNVTNMNNAFSNCYSLTTVPRFDTHNVTNMIDMFQGCSSLESVPLFSTGNVLTMREMFQNCSSLESVPQFDTSSVTNMDNMFNGCLNLVSVPQFDTSSVTGLGSMFSICTKLSDESLNNILAMCINATSYTGTNKTLAMLGIKKATLINKIPTLSNYQAFLDAGWTIQ